MADSQRSGRNYISFDVFDGMDTQSSRINLDPKKLAWLENLQPYGKNQAILVPGNNTPLVPVLPLAAGVKIFRAWGVFIGGFPGSSPFDATIYVATDGSMGQVNQLTGITTVFAPPGSYIPAFTDVTQWKNERVLIADTENGYSTWDGYAWIGGIGSALQVSPNITITNGGSGYVTPPTVTFSGGGASADAAGVAIVEFGIVVGVLVTFGGAGYTSAPTITFGSGAATATATLWPSLGPQLTLAVFAGRVWLGGGAMGAAEGRTLTWTGTAGYDDLDPANASGSTELVDADLVHRIAALRSLNNYLYIFGDASIKQIGSVSVQSSTTVFTIVSLSSDQGTLFPMSIRSFNRLVLFANTKGVFAIFGASVEKISDDMEGIFLNAVYPIIPGLVPLTELEPQAALVELNDIHTYLLLINSVDPYTNVQRSMIMALQGKKWFIVNAGNGIVALWSVVQGSAFIAFSSSTQDVTQILFAPNLSVSAVIRTSLSNDRKPMQGKRLLRALVGQKITSSTPVTVTPESELGSAAATTYNSTGALYQFQPLQLQQTGINLGVSITFTATMYNLSSIVLEYEDAADMRSSNLTA